MSSLVESNILDADGVRQIMRKKRLEYVIDHHNYDIWEGKDGRWKTYISDEDKPKGRRQISRATKTDLVEYLYKMYIAEDKDFLRKQASMESLYDEWADYKSIFVTESTIKRSANSWRSYYEGKSISKKPLVDITKDEIEKWILTNVREKNMNWHQYNNFIGVAKQIFEYAYEQGIIDTNPMDRVRIRNKRLIKPEPKKKASTEVFMPDERKKIIEKAYQHYDEQTHSVQRFTPLAIVFLFYVSLRRGELVAIKFDDIEGNQLILKDSYSHDMNKLKGRLKDGEGWRVVTLPEPALGIIEKVRSERERLDMSTDGYIFTVDEKFESLYCSLDRFIKKYCVELGIPKRSIHKTRKTCASMMHAAGIDDLTIQQQLGHKDIQTTYKSYCYDTTTDIEKYAAISRAMTEVKPQETA